MTGWPWPRRRGPPRVTVYRPAAVGLSRFGLWRPLPPALAGAEIPPGRFDAETMFFDVFHAGGGGILCLGPPLEGCRPEGLTARADAQGAPALAARTEGPRIPQQFASRLTLAGPGLGGIEALVFDGGGRQVEVPVNPGQARLLAGRRVLLTVSRDNPLPWIRDWARFHARLHGADAVLFYDNGSTAYGLDEVAAALAEVEGFREVVVVSWPFPYGVGGEPGQPAPDNYCQTGALDHARRCFCPRARSVLNLDVDELLLPGRAGIFAQVERSFRAVLLFRGVWVEAPGIDTLEAARRLRHGDCRFAWSAQLEALAAGRGEALCRTKWAAVPWRCDADLEWGVHGVYPATERAKARRGWRALDRTVAYRHFRQINTGWKTDRWRSSPDFDAVCRPDPALAAALDAAFGATG